MLGALLLLALSVVATVAIAWSCVAWGDLTVLHGQTVRPPDTAPGGVGWLAPDHLDWPAPVPARWPPARTTVQSESFGLRWRGGATSVGITPPFDGVQLVEAGWPFKALRWTEWFTSTAGNPYATESRGQGPLLQRRTIPGLAGSLTGFGWAGGFVKRYLPLDPIWPGLAANTVITVAALFLAVILPTRVLMTVRRRRRAVRGLCARCGYDLAGTTTDSCPECGAHVATKTQPLSGAPTVP